MASVLSRKHEIIVFGKEELKEKAQVYFGLDLQRVCFTPEKFGWKKTLGFDRFFYVTDGSLFATLAKKNYLIIQVPQKRMYSSDLIIRIKLMFWNKQLVYSSYVKQYIDKWWGTNALIFPPSINTEQFIIGNKENIILSVGRFFPLPHSKKQEILIEAFKKIKGWKLILAGGVDKAGEDYLDAIRQKCQDLNVEIFTNIPFEKLMELYSKAKIYWHAAGSGEDLHVYPERAEHFGITTLEAMASGCVPMVFPAGGQVEIVEDNKDGVYWQTSDELAEKTIKLIEDESKIKNLSQNAIKKSKEYDVEVFKKKLDELII